LTICGVLLGLTACAVGSESTALQAPADPPAGELHPDATEAGLLVLGMLSRGAEALATGNAAEALTFLDQAIEAGGEAPPRCSCAGSRTSRSAMPSRPSTTSSARSSSSPTTWPPGARWPARAAPATTSTAPWTP
jgi:hypothetical protein